MGQPAAGRHGQAVAEVELALEIGPEDAEAGVIADRPLDARAPETAVRVKVAPARVYLALIVIQAIDPAADRRVAFELQINAVHARIKEFNITPAIAPDAVAVFVPGLVRERQGRGPDQITEPRTA